MATIAKSSPLWMLMPIAAVALHLLMGDRTAYTLAPELDVSIRSEQVNPDDAGQIRFMARLMFKSMERAEISNVSLLVNGTQNLAVNLPMVEGEFDVSGMDGATGEVLGNVTFDSVSPMPPVYKARRTGGRVRIDVLWTPDSEQPAHGDYSATLLVETEGEDSPLTSDAARFTINSPTPTPTNTATPTATATPSPTSAPTASPTATPTRTRTPTTTRTTIPTPSSTPPLFISAIRTPTARAAATYTSTAIPTPTPSATQVPLLDESLSIDATEVTVTAAPPQTPTQAQAPDIAAHPASAHSQLTAAKAKSGSAQADPAPVASAAPTSPSVLTTLPAPAQTADAKPFDEAAAPDNNHAAQVSAPVSVAQTIIKTDIPMAVRLYPTDPSKPLRIIVDPPPIAPPLHEPASNANPTEESAVGQDNVADGPLMMRVSSFMLFAIASVAASALIEIWWRNGRATIEGE